MNTSGESGYQGEVPRYLGVAIEDLKLVFILEILRRGIKFLFC